MKRQQTFEKSPWGLAAVLLKVSASVWAMQVMGKSFAHINPTPAP